MKIIQGYGSITCQNLCNIADSPDGRPFEPRHEISNNVAFLTSVDSDEPVQPPVKIRNSKWCSVSSLTLLEYSND